jgi:hypothetical protein
MDDYSASDKNTIIQALIGGLTLNDGESLTDLINGQGRYYTVDYNYAEYYKYLNTMLACLAVYMSDGEGGKLFDKRIVYNGKEQKIGLIDWSEELNDSFKTFFSAKENIIFYLDSFDSVSESFSNNTAESSIASMVNGLSDQARELRYLLGETSAASMLINAGTEVTSSISSALSGIASGLAGGIVGSLAENGVNTILNGGKIIFPEVWSDSDYNKSYSLDIKLRSPDNDNLSIFLNILKPYCKILAMTLPRAREVQNGSLDPNSYGSPFLVKAFSKGMFSIDMGIITSLSVSKGATCCWNEDGLPTQIDISIEIKDLYSKLAMSTADISSPVKSIKGVINNTAYMDFLGNMAGLNIGQMEMGRKIHMAYYLTQHMIATAESTVFTRFDQTLSRFQHKMYNILS